MLLSNFSDKCHVSVWHSKMSHLVRGETSSSSIKDGNILQAT